LSKIKIAKQVPLNVLIKRIAKRLMPSERVDYSTQDLRKTGSNYTLNSLINISDYTPEIGEEVIARYLDHEFDLLGSGWVNRNLNKAIELNELQQFFAEKLFQHIDQDYQFINWQLDVRSNFEFNVKLQFDQQKIDASKHVDIKNCWELGRLQHLPQLAVAAITARDKNKLIKEFKNQTLDFIVSNPIGMGVQWACPMDVGIRLCNLLIAYDILKQLDKENLLDDAYVLIFTDAVYRHMIFIKDHLERKEGAAGNHYLFNLVGLLFATNYLSTKDETKEISAFAELELENEMFKQFFKDGGNFEGSTTYHCLSAEAVLYGTAMLLRNGKELSQEYMERLGKIACFIKDVMKPNGELPQFGDNDSGRLFKISSQSAGLNYASLLCGFSELLDGKYYGDSTCENFLVSELSGKRKLKWVDSVRKRNFQIRNAKHQVQQPKTTELKFPKDVDLESIKLFTYPDFGIYIYKSEQFYLAISAIANKKMHHSWGHVHNDKLSFELQVNHEDLVADPGTYTYSAFPEKRNEFRSAKAHHGIVIKGVEQNKLIDLFYMEPEVKCEVLEIKDLSITLEAKYYGVEHIRKFTILSNQLIVTDYCNKPFKVNINKFQEYAPNYGVTKKMDQ
jgi:hypothetical protein